MEMTVTRVQGVTSVRGREKPTLWIQTCTFKVAITFRGTRFSEMAALCRF